MSGDLVIAETDTATWHYHLRRVVDGRLYLGGGAPPALCSAKLGWDTRIPLSSWGKVGGYMPGHWCAACTAAASPTETTGKEPR